MIPSYPAGTLWRELPTYLLPGYEEYIVGYRDRSAVRAPPVAGRAVAGGNGMMIPAIVTNGMVAGEWKHTVGKRELSVELRPFQGMSQIQKNSVIAAAEQYGKFMGMPAVVEWQQDNP